MLEILDPGAEATVQDSGRIGFGHLGVPRAGAADLPSLWLGNRLLGNEPDAAGIEFLLGRAVLRAARTCLVALTGASCPATVEGRPIGFAQPVLLRAGETLRLGRVLQGLRVYLSVRGGVATPRYLGSRATDTLSGVGPQPLGAGDLLPVGTEGRPGVSRGLDFHLDPGRGAGRGVTLELPFRWGPRDDVLGEPARAALVSGTWLISSESSRVGVRLCGEPMTAGSGGDWPTEGLHPGSIQVPPSGLPLVFLANGPPTGGYPVIGVVARAGLYRLAQSVPGTRVVFRPVRHRAGDGSGSSSPR